MTTLATGLMIQTSQDTKMAPGLRLAIQRATSVFQKDFCYDLLQAMVDEPDIADPVGTRVFLNFCLKKPDSLIESFIDSIDQNVVSIKNVEAFNESAETILDEVENFIEFINGLVDMIDSGCVFKLTYHEIDAWKLCYRSLEQVQRRLFNLAVQDRQRITKNQIDDDDDDDKNLKDEENKQARTKSENGGEAGPTKPSKDEIELTFASESTNSGFFQAFVAIDKFLKHSFESRVLLEPAKLVEELDELNERRNELITFRTMFPVIHKSAIISKKHGRFGREEAAIDQFLESDKFKEISKRRAVMGGQLTRQPSTRAKKKPTAEEKLNHLTEPAISSKKRSVSVISGQNGSESNAIDPFLKEPPSPVGKPIFTTHGSDTDDDVVVHKRRRSFQSSKPANRQEPNGASSSSRKSSNRHSMPASAPAPSNSKKRRGRPFAPNERSESLNPNKRSRTSSSKRSSKNTNNNSKKQKLKSDDEDDRNGKGKRDDRDEEEGEEEGDDDDEQFVIDKIIGESVDIHGETIYKVLWAGYPESDATWQFANTLDDCAALDIWQEQKKLKEKQINEEKKNGTEKKSNEGEGEGEEESGKVENKKNKQVKEKGKSSSKRQGNGNDDQNEDEDGDYEEEEGGEGRVSKKVDDNDRKTNDDEDQEKISNSKNRNGQSTINGSIGSSSVDVTNQ